MQNLKRRLRALIPEIPLLSFTDETCGGLLEEYHRFYHIGVEGLKICSGAFEAHNHRIFGNILLPPRPKATVVFIHGLITHSGMHRYFKKWLLDNNYGVACYDLHGHGLSTGERIGISDFQDYGVAFQNFWSIVKENMPAPYHIVSHSTGSVGVLQHLAKEGATDMGRLVFLCPLVRSVAWTPTKLAHFALSPLVKFLPIPPLVEIATRDKVFSNNLRNDPLTDWKLAIQWVSALFDWDEENVHYKGFPASAKLILAQNDTVVSNTYNRDYFEKRFEKVDVSIIPNARHELLNEHQQTRSLVYHKILKYLEEGF